MDTDQRKAEQFLRRTNPESVESIGSASAEAEFDDRCLRSGGSDGSIEIELISSDRSQSGLLRIPEDLPPRAKHLVCVIEPFCRITAKRALKESCEPIAQRRVEPLRFDWNFSSARRRIAFAEFRRGAGRHLVERHRHCVTLRWRVPHLPRTERKIGIEIRRRAGVNLRERRA